MSNQLKHQNNTEIDYQHHIKRFEDKHNARTRLTPLGKAAVALGLGISVLAGAKVVDALPSDAAPSTKTHAITALAGEGVHSVIKRGTDNAGAMNMNELAYHVQNLESNQDTFANGQIDEGESVDVPVEVIENK